LSEFKKCSVTESELSEADNSGTEEKKDNEVKPLKSESVDTQKSKIFLI
jgi:transcription initiation factor IIE alpha subunit